MGVKIGDLKKDKIRKTYEYQGEKINVYNLFGKEKNEIMKYIKSKTKNLNLQELKIDDKEMLTYVYKKLTDLDFEGYSDDEIMNIINNPEPVLLEIKSDIDDIIFYLTKEIMYININNMRQSELMLDATKAFKSLNEITEKHNIDLSEIVKENIKKDKKQQNNKYNNTKKYYNKNKKYNKNSNNENSKIHKEINKNE